MIGMRIFRIFYVVISYVTICNTTNIENSEVPFFTALFVFSFGMFYDYLNVLFVGFKLNGKFQKRLNITLGILGVLASVLGLIIGFLGLIKLLNVVLVNNTLYVKSVEAFIWDILIDVKLGLKMLIIFIILAVCELGNEIKRVPSLEESIKERKEVAKPQVG